MQQNELLNDVLIVVGRSLLQYSAEVWPWSGGDGSSLRAAVDGLMAAQRDRIQKLADFLDGRRWAIDFGVFPDFTGLHYQSLDFLVPHLVENQRTVVAEIETARGECVDDPEGLALLDEILQGEQAALATLEELSRPHPVKPAQSAA